VLATFVPDHARETLLDSLVALPVPGPLARVEVGLVGLPESSPSAAALASWLRR
jgi:hypothetical protein